MSALIENLALFPTAGLSWFIASKQESNMRGVLIYFFWGGV